MSKKSNKLQNTKLALLYVAPLALFFSYYPIIPLGSSASTNFELSLALIWLFLFSVLSLKDAILYIYNIYLAFLRQKAPKHALPLLTLLFPLYLSLSVLWSPNPLRAVLTAGILWCLYISAIEITLLAKVKTLNRSLLTKVFLYGTASICLVCWLQSLLDTYGLSRETTLLCRGCTSLMFGFPHPSGFTIEPQFMGNLLLAPTLFVVYLSSRPQSPLKSSHLSLLFVFASTLFLTFSRGAIYSFAVAYLLFFVVSLATQKNRSIFKSLPVVVFSFLFTLASQGVFAANSPTSDTFLSGVEKSLSQLSLGTINLDLDSSNALVSTSTESAIEETPKAPETLILVEDHASVFSGYVAESTDIRLNFSRIALELATSSPARFFFGTGLGSAGSVMYATGKTSSPKEIIQNQYLSLLLETGLLGLLFAALVVVYVIYIVKKTFSAPERLLLFSALLSFALSLNFFAGLPNALHLYLFPVILSLFLPRRSKNKRVINQEV